MPQNLDVMPDTSAAGATAGNSAVFSLGNDIPTDSPSCAPPEDEVARLAYLRWETRVRDGHPGSAEDDWLGAEADLKRSTDSVSGE